MRNFTSIKLISSLTSLLRFRILQQRNPDICNRFHEKTFRAANRLEKHLYMTASSFESHIDCDTLKERVFKLVKELIDP